MKYLLKPTEYFKYNHPFPIQLLTIWIGMTLFIKAGAYLPNSLLTHYIFPIHLITHIISCFFLYITMCLIIYLVSKPFAPQIRFKSYFTHLGYIGIPRLIFGICFYLIYFYADLSSFNIFLMTLVTIAVTTAILQIYLLYLSIRILGNLTFIKSILLTCIVTICFLIFSNLLDPSTIAHPYNQFIIHHIDIH